MLKNILMAEIMPIVEEFDQQKNNGHRQQQTISLLQPQGCPEPLDDSPHVVQGAVYNCMTCQYDSCEFPLDCP
ncbi:hypothetical protein cypCar_00040620, partial [Cyprinus carpio]